MSDYLTIVRTVYSGLSQREVAKTHQVFRNTVALLLRHAKSQGWLTLEDLNLADNAFLSAALGKESNVSRDETFRMPDYEYVHTELAKPHVTLNLLWEDYCSLSSIVAIINMQPSSFHNSNRLNGWIRSPFRLLLKRLQTVFQRKHTRSSFRANNLCGYKSTKPRGHLLAEMALSLGATGSEQFTLVALSKRSTHYLFAE